ncbi:MAG: protein kinase [Propionibacteriaceae bacterium]|jgi:serine/threonine-protein kinase PknG|nr:protein kinase [Propionibacteriaceae bacterium]
MPGCSGVIQDGYCTVCGAPAGATAPPPTPAGPTATLLTGQIGATALGSVRLAPGQRAAVTARTRASAVRPRSGALGAGLTHVPEQPAVDPASAILANPVIPEDRRNCPSCGAPVGRAGEGGAGRLEGFCPQCRQPYSFTVKLQPGELVAGQYEVRGPLAYGGMGWIYLAQDRNVSNRWVVLKGLLNVGDDSAQASAIAEQRFLAEVQHPLIVEIFNFVTHRNAAYIVMEFVNGRSVKQVLKDRLNAHGGTYDPLPLDQACAVILGVLPAFDYLHHRGLLYCDFKPDNLMQIADTVKLIDLGGVRRADDDVSPIFGTVGFQAPEVATAGCSVASDIYTIGRTLMVCCAEVRGYQSTYQHSLPPPDQLGALGRSDALYRLIAKACAPVAADRFGSVEEFRTQLLGVLRQLVGTARGGAATQTAASELFEAPTIAADAFDWTQLPRLKPDVLDPAYDWVAGLAGLTAAHRLRALANPPAVTPEVLLAASWSALAVGDHALVARHVETLLAADPWDWRAAWMAGLSALVQGHWEDAQTYFNAVFGQTPGELAPQFVLAVACEMGQQPAVAEGLYAACAATDQGYLTAASFGLARIRAQRRTPEGALADLDGVLTALAMIPPTARGYLEAHRLAATYLVNSGQGLADLQRALDASRAARLDPVSQAKVDVQVYQRALALAPPHRATGPARLGDTPFSGPAIRRKLEETLRTWAKLEQDPARRTQLTEEANRTRKWTLV